MACSHQKTLSAQLREEIPLKSIRSYEDVLDFWTKNDKLYRKFDNKLFISATYHAQTLRKAFAIAFPEIYGAGGDIVRRELVTLEEGRLNNYLNFFIAAYTPNSRWNDFDRSDSIWRMTFESQYCKRSLPVEIVQVRIDENLKAVYPYIGRFDKAYVARFQRLNEHGQECLNETHDSFSLRVVSALGAITLRWQEDRR